MTDQQTTQPIIGKTFPDIVTPIIKQAKKSIDIIVFDWRWYPDQIGSTIQKFNNAIIDSAKKGIRIRALTNSSQIQRLLSENRIKTKKLHSKKLLHTKLMLVDNKIAILGSHNYTMNAFTINFEVSVILVDPPTIKRLNEYFINLWSL